MKTQAMSAGLRVTLSKSELDTLLTLLRHSAAHPSGDRPWLLSGRQATLAPAIIDQLEKGLASLRWKQAEARSRREAPRREAERRAAREHHASIDGFSVWGILGDWVDISEDPDRRQWADLFHPDTVPRDQGEIRRGVWRIFISKGRTSSDDSVVLPGDCTLTADRDEIADLARRIISSHAP
jgi:hypothetical protein